MLSSTRTTRRPAERRRNRRKLRSGLLADFGTGPVSVQNYSIDGLLIADCGLPVTLGAQILVTLSWEDRSREHMNAYCVVARIDRFRNETAFSFVNLTDDLFDFIERSRIRSAKPIPSRG